MYADKAKARRYNAAYRVRHADKLKAYDVAYRQANPRIIKNNNLRLNNWTLPQYETALIEQNNRCAICSRDLRLLPSKHVHADHCRIAKKPRGVLCHWCNIGLGLFSDNIGNLTAAVDYLLHWRK